MRVGSESASASQMVSCSVIARLSVFDDETFKQRTSSFRSHPAPARFTACLEIDSSYNSPSMSCWRWRVELLIRSSCKSRASERVMLVPFKS